MTQSNDLKTLTENFENFINYTQYAEIISEHDIDGQKNSAVYKILYEGEDNPAVNTSKTNDTSAVDKANFAKLVTINTTTSIPSVTSFTMLATDIKDKKTLTNFESELNKLAEQKKKYGNDQQLIKEAVDVVNVLVVWRMLMSVPNFAKLFGMLSKWVSKTFIAPFNKPNSEKGLISKALSTVWHAFNKVGGVWVLNLLGKIILSMINVLKAPMSGAISGFLLSIPSVDAKIKSKELTTADIKQLSDRVSLLVISVIITIIAPYSWGFQAAGATGNIISATVLKLDLEKKTGIKGSDIVSAAKEGNIIMNSIMTQVKDTVVDAGKEVWDAAMNKDSSKQDDTKVTGKPSSGVSDMDFAQFSQNVTIG